MTEAARKRANNEMDDESPPKKQQRNGGAMGIHLKLLIPNNLAGVVLGKGGETIKRIQEEAGIKAHTSKGNEYFPGTSDRICTLSGYDTNGIKEGVNKICEKLFEKMASSNEKMTLKILVPNATAGMVIGKGGEHIRSIKENTGALVQVSRKNELPERCITVSGKKEEIAKAVDDLVEKIAEDPLSGSCLSLNYSSYTDSLTPMNSMSSIRPSLFADFNNSGDDFDRSDDLNLSFNFVSARSTGNSFPSPDLLDQIAFLLKGGGYRLSAINEITAAIELLIRYGVLSSNSKRGGSFNSAPFSSFDNFGNGFARFSRNKDANDSYLLPSHFGEDDSGKYLALKVPHQKVGAIIGTRGATLAEIRQLSKARVHVSKKEDGADGNNERLVYIYGGKEEMDFARSLVEWKVKEFDAKHSRS